MTDSLYRRAVTWVDGFLGRALLRGLAVLVLIAGTGATWMGVSAAGRSLRSLSWPTVEGRVLESEVRRLRRSWRPAIRYAYTLGDAQYQGNGMGYPVRGAPRDPGGVFAWSLERTEETVRRLPEGSAVTVHYAPGDPRWSVIEPTFAWATLIPLGAGLGFLALGVWLWRVKKRISDLDWSGV